MCVGSCTSSVWILGRELSGAVNAVSPRGLGVLQAESQSPVKPLQHRQEHTSPALPYTHPFAPAAYTH